MVLYGKISGLSSSAEPFHLRQSTDDDSQLDASYSTVPWNLVQQPM
jgi:hypothetical protein